MEDDNKEELHFKSLAADLKDLPPFERLNAEKGNKRRCAQVSNGSDVQTATFLFSKKQNKSTNTSQFFSNMVYQLIIIQVFH